MAEQENRDSAGPVKNSADSLVCQCSLVHKVKSVIIIAWFKPDRKSYSAQKISSIFVNLLKNVLFFQKKDLSGIKRRFVRILP